MIAVCLQRVPCTNEGNNSAVDVATLGPEQTPNGCPVFVGTGTTKLSHSVMLKNCLKIGAPVDVSSNGVMAVKTTGQWIGSSTGRHRQWAYQGIPISAVHVCKQPDCPILT